MIYKDIKLFSQNVQKNSLIIKTILEIKTNFDIIFIQESSWTTIHSIPSSINCKGELLVGVINHWNWITFTRSYTNKSTNTKPRFVCCLTPLTQHHSLGFSSIPIHAQWTHQGSGSPFSPRRSTYSPFIILFL